MKYVGTTLKLAAAAAVAAGSMAFGPAAQAGVCVSDVWVDDSLPLCDGFVAEVGDKRIEILDFDANNNNGFGIELRQSGMFYDVVIDWFTDTGNGPNQGSDTAGLSGFVNYLLTITNPLYQFNTVSLSQDAAAPTSGGSQWVQKTVTPDVGDIIQLEVIGSGSDGPIFFQEGVRSVTVRDEFLAQGGQLIVSDVNEFTQDIPAPATVLLFGAGLLGLGLKRRKQA